MKKTELLSTISIFNLLCVYSNDQSQNGRFEKKTQAMEMNCFRKLLGRSISYREHITNKEVKTRTENAIGQYEDLVTNKVPEHTPLIS